MTKNNAAQSGENGRRDESSLDSRYGEIGISAVAAALPFRSEVKNPAYARPSINRTSGPRSWRPDRPAQAPSPASVSRRIKSVRSRSGFVPAALLASPLIVLARTGLIGPSLAQ